jgi:DNA-binding CsgD family transcriptional regulator
MTVDGIALIQRSAEADRRAPDFDRRSDAMSVLAMVDFLRSLPTVDQIAEYLVLLLMPGRGVEAAVISLVQSDGSLEVRGRFGLAQEMLAPLDHAKLAALTPMTDALRLGEAQFLPTGAAVSERYGALGEFAHLCVPTAAWPLTLPSRRVGAVQLLFQEGADEERMRGALGGLTGAMSLFLSLRHDAPAAVPAAPASPTAPATIVDLTARQFRILQMMAEGMTNLKISNRIGFSESTVRQETMAVYRHFGVHDRREAVRVAASRGLISGAINPEDIPAD